MDLETGRGGLDVNRLAVEAFAEGCFIPCREGFLGASHGVWFRQTR